MYRLARELQRPGSYAFAFTLIVGLAVRLELSGLVLFVAALFIWAAYRLAVDAMLHYGKKKQRTLADWEKHFDEFEFASRIGLNQLIDPEKKLTRQEAANLFNQYGVVVAPENS